MLLTVRNQHNTIEKCSQQLSSAPPVYDNAKTRLVLVNISSVVMAAPDAF